VCRHDLKGPRAALHLYAFAVNRGLESDSYVQSSASSQPLDDPPSAYDDEIDEVVERYIPNPRPPLPPVPNSSRRPER